MNKIKVGRVYKQNATGLSGKYVCIATGSEQNEFNFMRIGDGWTLTAHNAKLDELDYLSWDYSTKGHWAK